MADRVFPLSGDKEELHKRGFTRPTSTTYTLPPAFRERRRSCPRCSCCCYVCVATASFFLMLFIVGAALYLLLRPKAPSFSITRAHITQFALIAKQEQPSGSADLHLHSDMNFTIVAANANKKIGFHYEKIAVELVYGEQVIGRGALAAALYVGPQGRFSVELQMKGADTLLRQKAGLSLQKALQDRSSGSDGVRMQVDASAHLRVQVWSVRSRIVRVHILCDVHMSRPLPHTDAHLLSKSCALKSLAL